jgi:NitT/TauT family transport system permease protein
MLTPNSVLPSAVMRIVIIAEIGLFLLLWFLSPFKILPRPNEVFAALGGLWTKQGLGAELITSLGLNLQALALASLICVALAYLTVLPIFRPIVQAITKGRFLSLVGFSLIFTLLLGGGRPVKLAMMVFAISVFLLTSLVAIVAEIPKKEFDHARTLRMGEWRVVWEVVVRGTIDKVLDGIRQNAAIGWALLPMVETLVRSEGGVGVLLVNQQKYFHIADVFAIQLVIVIVGLVQDYVLGLIRQILCPWADLTKERLDR